MNSRSPIHFDRRVSDAADLSAFEAVRSIPQPTRTELGQFLTPPAVSNSLARMLHLGGSTIRLLDAGAGVGGLVAAVVDELVARKHAPETLHVTAIEVFEPFHERLHHTLGLCRAACQEIGTHFEAEVIGADFIQWAADAVLVGQSLLNGDAPRFDAAILNPPYRKITASSATRRTLSAAGIETSNLYTAFLSLTANLLKVNGELAAITPRSFANGPYFKPFRRQFFGQMALREIHLYDSRSHAFKNDDVLQENILFSARKQRRRPKYVTVRTSQGPDDEGTTIDRVEYERVIHSRDEDMVLHLHAGRVDQEIARRIERFDQTLAHLGVSVSTGRVVDFRAKEHLRSKSGPGCVPLIYPAHFSKGRVDWQNRTARKANALKLDDATSSLTVPRGNYVLVKRFSSKEERRRVVAAVYEARANDAEVVGFENHLNYLHHDGRGLPLDLARGISAYLNSTLLDLHFRQFSGHTQVNATDLRGLPFPNGSALESIGRLLGSTLPNQAELDRLLKENLAGMAELDDSLDPVAIKARVEEARAVLKALGLPKAQQNERSALTLLAIIDLPPDSPWKDATAPLRGITQMMDFMRDAYGKNYAPNTRETVRRQSVHQFIEAGIVVQNPDDPSRPTNSGKNVYQIEVATLGALRRHGQADFASRVESLVDVLGTLTAKYKQEREQHKIPVTLPHGKKLKFTPGGQNVLIEKIINEFCPRFAPGGEVLVVGDTGDKWLFTDGPRLAELGINVNVHGKFPDIVVHMEEKNWLLLIEAVTSHGPVNPKRHQELVDLFAESTAGLVFVTAFLDRKTFGKYLADIAWETEVWVADSPGHMIHFNGERFLGPYASPDI